MHVRIIVTEFKMGNEFRLHGERLDPDHVYYSPQDALLDALRIAAQVGVGQLHVHVSGLVRDEMAQLKGTSPAMALTRGNKIIKLVYFWPGRRE